MSQLVRKLSEQENPVEIILWPTQTLAALKECVDQGYLNIRFTNTQGGTELHVILDRHASKLQGDFERGIGHLQIVGRLTLDYVKVTCVVEIDLPSFVGKGLLIPVDVATASKVGQ